MPSSIPYDPSLVLGNIVDRETLDKVRAIGDVQAEADAKEDVLNDKITLKRSLDLTLIELLEMGSYTEQGNQQESQKIKELKTKIDKIKREIYSAAVDYANVKTAVLDKVAKLKAGKKKKGGKKDGEGVVNYTMESPIDYTRTNIKKMPISADSLKLNAQYFSYEKNKQSSQSMAASIKSFITLEVEETFGPGNKASMNAASSAARQAHHQYENHSTTGTLVISIMCTHKDAALLAPLVIDPDKAIRAWNRMFDGDKLDTRDPASVAKVAVGQSTNSKNVVEIISGATYGSSFVAMVHVLNTSETEVSESMNSVAAQIQAQATRGWVLASVTGGFGLDASYSNALKSLLSTQEIQSHCNIVTMGAIPSIKANDVKMAVKQFTKFDGEESMGKLAALQNAQATGIDSMNSTSGKAARTGSDLVALEATKVQSVMSAVSKMDEHANKILDINSVMNAMDDYIQKALEGNLGVPINYYLKAITKDELAHLWIDKYYPFFFTQKLGMAKQDGSGSGQQQ